MKYYVIELSNGEFEVVSQKKLQGMSTKAINKKEPFHWKVITSFKTSNK